MTNYISILALAIGLFASNSTELCAAQNDYPQRAYTATAAYTDAHDNSQQKTTPQSLAPQKLAHKKLTLMQRIQQHYKNFMAQSFMRKFVTGVTTTAASIYAARTLFEPLDIDKEKAKIREEEKIKKSIRQEKRRRIIEEAEIREEIQREERNRIAHEKREAARERIRLDQLERQALRAQEEQARKIKNMTTKALNLVSILREDTELLLEYLGNGVPVDARDDNGNTLLHIAAFNGHNNIITALLAKKATVNAVNTDGKTPLEVALTPKFAPSDRLKETIAALLAHGADKQPLITRLKSIAANVQDYSYDTLILDHVDSADIAAIDRKDLPLFLLVAVRNGYDGLVETILKRDKNLTNITNAKRESCLLVATKNGLTKTALVLLNYGADHTPTIFEHASESSNSEIIKKLLDCGAQHTPRLFRKAIMYNHVKVARLFIENGADVNEIYNLTTPLMTAAYYGQLECAKLLLKHGADINREDNHHNTALYYALSSPYEYRSNYISMTNLLLARGAQINTGSPAIIYISVSPTFPLRTAISTNNLLTTQMLILAGADVHQTDDRGKSALTCTGGDMLETIKKAESIREQLDNPNYEIPADMGKRTKKLVKYELMHRQHKKQADKNALAFLQSNQTFEDILIPEGVDALICEYADVTLYDHVALDMRTRANALKLLQKNKAFADILPPRGIDKLICDYADLTLDDHTALDMQEEAEDARAMP